MTSVDGSNARLCEKLKALGYADRNRIRIYGEEFDLLSNPISDEHGVSIEAKSRNLLAAPDVRDLASIETPSSSEIGLDNKSNSSLYIRIRLQHTCPCALILYSNLDCLPS